MKKTKRKPTPAQIRARKAFGRMAKQRARLSRLKRKRNVTMGFRDSRGVFHPIRESEDYSKAKAGETGKAPKRTKSTKVKRAMKKAASTARGRAATKARKATTSRLAGRALSRSVSLPPVKRKRKNPSAVLRKKRERFTGKKSKQTLNLIAPTGAPKQFAILGRLKAIKTRGKVLSVPRSKNPNGNGVYLAEDAGGHLHIIGDPLPVLPEKGRDLGPITEIEYIAQKPHLGYPDTTEFFHEFGERGGEKPHLVTDAEGALWIEGGDYFITERGVENPGRRKRRRATKRRS